jgi:hypothetical protein
MHYMSSSDAPVRELAAGGGMHISGGFSEAFTPAHLTGLREIARCVEN